MDIDDDEAFLYGGTPEPAPAQPGSFPPLPLRTTTNLISLALSSCERLRDTPNAVRTAFLILCRVR